jgi:hypothetical protein
LLNIFRFPSRSLCKDRDAPLPKPSLTCLRVPSKDDTPPPLQVSLTKPLHTERCSISRAFFYISLYKSPAKEPPSRFPSQSSHRKRRSVSKAFFYLSLKVPPPSSPNGAPMERDSRHQSLLLHILQSPSKGVPSQSPLRERRSPSRAFFYLSLEVPGEGVPPPSSPSGAPMERDAPSRAFFYISLYLKSLSPPFCLRVVCKPDKPLDIRRSLWAAFIKGNAPFPEPWINSFIHISRCPHLRSSPTTHGEKNTVTVHGAPRGRKAYIHWGAAWFPKGSFTTLLLTTPVPCSLRHDTFHLGLGRPEPR